MLANDHFLPTVNLIDESLIIEERFAPHRYKRPRANQILIMVILWKYIYAVLLRNARNGQK